MIAFVDAVGTGVDGIIGPGLFGVLIGIGLRSSVFNGYLLGATLMVVGGLIVRGRCRRALLEVAARSLTKK